MKNTKNNAPDLLWAPWRMEYILRPKPEDGSGCVFCTKAEKNEDEKDLILYRGETVFVIMNLYPYNNGHIMVVPYRHISTYGEMTEEERHEMSDVTAVCLDILGEKLYPGGFNVGLNLGRAAGAGIDDHIHQHIVPRWDGDTNFMPVLGHTKVLVDGLKETWSVLKKAFEEYE
jgi:ATP adenylyltransferase